MDDGVERPLLVAEDRRQGRLITQVDPGEAGAAAGDRRHPPQGLGLAVTQIVDDEDLMARRQQFHAGVAADVARAARDQDVHLFTACC